MSSKESGRSIFAGRSARITQKEFKAIIGHHGHTCQFRKHGSVRCTCWDDTFAAGDPDCIVCDATGYLPTIIMYMKAFFTPYSYFSGTDNQQLFYRMGEKERSQIKMYIDGDTMRNYEVRNRDYVKWRNVNYRIVSIFSYTGTDSYLDGFELKRRMVYAECTLQIEIDDKSQFTESEMVQ